MIFFLQILQRYRFDRETINEIVDMIRPALTRRTGRSQALSALEQVLVTLRFYATGSMQQVVADTGAISQSSVSRSVTSVTDALVEIAPRHIFMPRTDVELMEVKKFMTCFDQICLTHL